MVGSHAYHSYPGGYCCLRNNSLMSCVMLILTWGGIIFVDMFTLSELWHCVRYSMYTERIMALCKIFDVHRANYGTV